VGIPLERTGGLLVAWNEEQLARFPAIQDAAARNGYTKTRRVEPDELYRLEPHLGPGAHGALAIPDEHIVCPWTPPLASATQAVLAGVELRRHTRVTGLRRDTDWHVDTTGGTLRARWVVNAAGLYSDEVHRMAGRDGFTVIPAAAS
jgi:glycerol-3-phosphate dehydrogenase